MATALGSPIAGGILLASNYKRLDNPSSAFQVIAGTVVFTAVILVIAFIVPESTPNMPFLVVQMYGMWFLSKKLFESTIDSHQEAGGEMASMWHAAGVGIVAMLIFLATLIGVIFLMEPDIGTQVAISANDDVYYSGEATEDDAKELGRFLTDSDYFTNDGATVLISRASGQFTITFVVVDGAWNEPDTVNYYRGLAEELAARRFGPALVLAFCDENIETRKSIDITVQANIP